MKICDLDQNGSDWHKWRAEGLGGSDAPTVMDENSFQCRDELTAVKLGRRNVPETAAMARGKRLEPTARQLYMQMTGINVRPVCVIHDQYPWLRASLDGLSDDHKVVLEIKCPTSPGTHLCALRGYPPRYYRAQLQHQLAVTGCQELHFFTYFPDSGFPPEQQIALAKVRPDRVYISRLIERERRYWEHLQKEREFEGT